MGAASATLPARIAPQPHSHFLTPGGLQVLGLRKSTSLRVRSSERKISGFALRPLVADGATGLTDGLGAELLAIIGTDNAGLSVPVGSYRKGYKAELTIESVPVETYVWISPN